MVSGAAYWLLRGQLLTGSATGGRGQFKRFICMPARSFLIEQPAALIVVVVIVSVSLSVSVAAPGTWKRKL